MPLLNRSQSSPDAGIRPLQAPDTYFSRNSRSMPVSDTPSSSYNASIKRLGYRRIRPSVASIADIFVNSLVMASFCRDHSPRNRGLSTMAVKTSTHNMSRMKGKSLATIRQLTSGKRPVPSSSPVECFGFDRLRTQRTFNSGVVQKVKDDDHGEGYGPQKNVTGLDQGAEDLEAGRNQGHNSQSALLRSKRKSFLDDNGPSKEPHPSDSDEFVSNQTRDQFDALEGPIHLIEPLSGKELNASSWGAHPKQLEHLLDRKKAPEPDADCSKAPSPPLKVGKDTNRDAIEFQAVERFLEAVKDPKKTNQYIFRLYRDLPSPGVAHLSKRTRGLLLRRMSQPPNRRWADARRYLAIVEDMIAAKLPLSPALWTSAIHLAGRAMGHVKKQDLVRSIGIWQQMEHLAGIESDPVVFTILFDIAIKASQFTVADRLLQEMSKRGIEFRRAGKVSKIYYYGMLRDVNGIHRAFDEFLAAGEIVDTAVLNCLMTSFIRAGKIRIAESLYERMMQAQAAARPAGDTDHKGGSSTHQPALASELVLYRKAAKELNRAFEMATRIKHTLPAHHRALQESIPMSPDTRTFHIFLSYHAIHSGNLQAFSKIVDDMEKTFAIPPRGMIYLLLFEGFARHGRKKKGWTADKLRFAWRSYVRALYESRTRLNGDFSIHRPALTWENPLKADSPTVMTTLADSSRPTVGLYTPLPSSTGETKAVSNVSERADGSNVPSISEIKDTPEQNEVQHNSQRMDEKEDETNDGEEIIELDDGIDLDVDDLFLAPTESAPSDSDPMEHELGRRIENGVFLGRRMILLIIRAFGTCCGPEEVMDVWLSLERIWRPQKRKSLDVLAVKEELNKYIKDLTGR